MLDLLSVWASEFETNQAPLYLKQKRVINHIWAQVAFWCPLFFIGKANCFSSSCRTLEWNQDEGLNLDMKLHLEPWTWHFAWFKRHFNGKTGESTFSFIFNFPSQCPAPCYLCTLSEQYFEVPMFNSQIIYWSPIMVRYYMRFFKSYKGEFNILCVLNAYMRLRKRILEKVMLKTYTAGSVSKEIWGEKWDHFFNW